MMKVTSIANFNHETFDFCHFPADEEDDTSEEKASKTIKKVSQPPLDVPSSTNRAVSPAPKSIHSGDKGKSKITGKTLTGWI